MPPTSEPLSGRCILSYTSGARKGRERAIAGGNRHRRSERSKTQWKSPGKFEGEKVRHALIMPQPITQRLDSWKEIATYLGRDLRTVRRWEKEKGLPVHRVPGGERQAVFAYATEIDGWLLRTDTQSPQPPQNGNAAPNPAGLKPAGPGTAVFTPRAAPPTVWWWKPIFTLRRATLALLLLALLAAVAFGLVLINARPMEQPLDHVDFRGNSLQGWSPSGQLLWTYSFDQPLQETEEKDFSRIQIADLGEGAHKQVLAAVPLNAPDQRNALSDALYSLSSDGKMLWRYDFNQTFQFAGNAYGPPWYFGATLVVRDGLNSYIWSAADETFWSPSSLVKLDSAGRVLANFVNWGHIHVLKHFTSPQGSFILAGGINNECNCAMLAVLREDQPSGVSPAVTPANGNPELRCENCPAGRPYRYLLFPRSEVAIATGTTYNQVAVILSSEGDVKVGVAETTGNGTLGADWEMFDLSSDFVPRTFSVSDHIRVLHQQLEAQGKIKHTADTCPELHHPRSVKVWSPDEGWKTVAAQPITRP